MNSNKLKLFILILTGLAILANFSFAEDVVLEKAKIKTSAQCDMCKDRIEKAMKDVKGISNPVLNVDTKFFTADFNPKVITLDGIRSELNKIGYDADDTQASKKAYNKLPKCCKKGGH